MIVIDFNDWLERFDTIIMGIKTLVYKYSVQLFSIQRKLIRRECKREFAISTLNLYSKVI